MMRVERLERPASGVVTIADAKIYARIEGDDENSALARMCVSAVLEFEDRAQLALLSQAVRVTLPHWPEGKALALPLGPVVAPATVTVTAGGEEFEGYSIEAGQRPALRLTGPRPQGRIVAEYIAGFGDDGADVPEDIRHALCDQVATYYDARGAQDGKLLSVSPHFARIASRYRGVKA